MIEKFIVFGVTQRTNNVAEGWHHHMNKSIEKIHPSPYELINFMQNEQALT